MAASAEPVAESDSATEDIRRARLWPAWIVCALQAIALVITVTPEINNFVRFGYMMLGPIVNGLLFLIWLLGFSRLAWKARFGILAGITATGIAAGFLADESMRVSLWAYGIPLALFLTTAMLTVNEIVGSSRNVSSTIAAVGCGWAVFTLGRVTGVDGSYYPEMQWRWTSTAEERLASIEGSTIAADDAQRIQRTSHDWPEFRGPKRDGRSDSPEFATNWSQTKPRELWRIPVGPAWSSFAVVGDRLFTQEQRSQSEAVICLQMATGEEIWRHNDNNRFSDVVAGAGPRSTPTFADGMLFTLGAKAILNCLDAATGQLIWSHDLVEETDAEQPVWGFSGSPLVVDGQVIVYAGGTNDRGLVAYDAQTGESTWHVPGKGMNFASAQLEEFDETRLILFTNEAGLVGIEPGTGQILWQFTPSEWESNPMVQPHRIGPRSLIVTLGDGVGVARLEVEQVDSQWKVTESWSSRNLKPSFNDFVYHEGHLYGFDQSIFACVDAGSGERAWKRGRYGFGQIVLAKNSDAIIVLAESGEVVVVAADPAGHRELARMQAIEGKTWNHPVLSGDKLILRNGQEAVCYQLPAVK